MNRETGGESSHLGNFSQAAGGWCGVMVRTMTEGRTIAALRWWGQREGVEERRRRFEALARPLQDEIFRTARRFCGNETDAWDISQEAFVRAYEHFDRFEPGSNFRAWLHRILKNVFINHYHRQRARAEVSLEERDPGGGAPADAALLHAALEEEVEQALAALTTEFRAVVVMADMQELSYDEISRALQVPVGTVRSRLFRARRLLQKSLHDYARRRRLLPE